jgi:DNA end-binding protein Ku
MRPFNSTMLLTTLHWPDEVRSIEELDVPTDDVEIKPAERKMAEQLVASMTGEFHPEQYRDEYREALMGVIEAKVGGEAPQPAAKTEPTKIADLMAALEASVSAARETRRTGSAVTAKAADADTRKAKAAKAANEKPADEKPARRRKTA